MSHEAISMNLALSNPLEMRQNKQTSHDSKVLPDLRLYFDKGIEYNTFN